MQTRHGALRWITPKAVGNNELENEHDFELNIISVRVALPRAVEFRDD